MSDSSLKFNNARSMSTGPTQTKKKNLYGSFCVAVVRMSKPSVMYRYTMSKCLWKFLLPTMSIGSFSLLWMFCFPDVLLAEQQTTET